MFLAKWKNRTDTPTYNSWRSMRNRILFNSSDSHKFYKEKSVKICDRWVGDYDTFVEDMGERPEGTTLDRIDPNGDYTPENCRWASHRVQQNNKLSLTKIMHKDVEKTIGEWGFELDLSERQMNTVYKRYSFYGAKTYDELFCENLHSFRKSQEKHICEICSATESKKWRSSKCANCYARALRLSKKLSIAVDEASLILLKQKHDERGESK